MDSKNRAQLRPSEVRLIILGEHDAIRKHLIEIEGLAQANDSTGLASALTQFQKLFLAHLQHEEAILLPILQTIDSWGPVRIASISKEHKEQRQMIKNLNSLIDVKEFIAHLTCDMAAEEKDFLSPDFLKDDLIGTGYCG